MSLRNQKPRTPVSGKNSPDQDFTKNLRPFSEYRAVNKTLVPVNMVHFWRLIYAIAQVIIRPTFVFIGGSQGGRQGRAPPPLGPNFFNFMQFLGKIGKNNRLVPPPLQLAHPPLGNPGSATGITLFGALSETWIKYCLATLQMLISWRNPGSTTAREQQINIIFSSNPLYYYV